MSLAEGQRLGPYVVLERIGAGGMGEVYRARDTRLDRTVALKVVRDERLASPQLRSRLEREARTISLLAHPNICTLFDVGQQDGQTFLVMEHLEGQTLSHRLLSGSLALARSLEVAIQIADALSAAHKQGVVHRDLKPGNVMLTRNGAKLLDFGLARLTGPAEPPAGSGRTLAPTESQPLTGGSILGTLLYMAPEQIEGRPADARTDLWALGLLIYEMLTGSRAFEGTSQTSLIGAILEREPEPLSRLQPLTPPPLERLVKRCLAKSPDDRWATAHDVAGELRWIAEAGAAGTGGGRPGPRWTRPLGLAGAAIACVLAGVLAGRSWLPSEAPSSLVVRTSLDVRPADELDLRASLPLVRPPSWGSRTALDWTVDGHALVFVGRRGPEMPGQLYVRDLDQDEARLLAGTEGAQAPAVSPDGRWVAFWARGQIKKIPITGGPTSVLVSQPRSPWGIAWGPSGRIYYGQPDDRIWSVAPEAAPEPVTTLLDSEFSHSLPQVLPAGNALVFTVRRRFWTWGDEEVVAQDLATRGRQTLIRNAADARYVRSGHLVFMRQGMLMAVPFDPGGLTVRGEPTPVMEGIAQALTAGSSLDVTGAGQFAVARSGTLAYVAGPVRPYRKKALVAVDREGGVSPIGVAMQSYAPSVRLAPDGRRLVVVTHEVHEMGLWIVDMSRGTLMRLPGIGELDWPTWTPDGQRVAFLGLVNGVPQLFWQRADVTAAAEPLFREAHDLSSWSPDGQHLATVHDDDIWIVTLTGSTPTLERLTQTKDREAWPEFSPDGRWLAYGSDGTGRSEIYVRPWPGRGLPEQVSLEGGTSPAWNPNGRELFFLSHLDPVNERQRMWAVDLATRPKLRIGRPQPLFDYSGLGLSLSCAPVRCYAVSQDGSRFFATQRQPQPPVEPVTHVRIVQGWLEELKARASGAAAR